MAREGRGRGKGVESAGDGGGGREGKERERKREREREGEQIILCSGGKGGGIGEGIQLLAPFCLFYTYRYCPSCKTDSTEVIGAGEKMRMTKKKAGMMSNKGSCNRDWGKVRGGVVCRLLEEGWVIFQRL